MQRFKELGHIVLANFNDRSVEPVVLHVGMGRLGCLPESVVEFAAKGIQEGL